MAGRREDGSLRVFFWHGLEGCPIVGVECSGRTLADQDCMERWLSRRIAAGRVDHCKTVGEARRCLTAMLRDALATSEVLGPPSEQLRGEPVGLRAYEARVEADGDLSLILWENSRPLPVVGGRRVRESLAVINPTKQPHVCVEGPPPREGDLLRLWTWREQVDGKLVPRVYAKVQPRPTVSAEERAELLLLLEQKPAV